MDKHIGHDIHYDDHMIGLQELFRKYGTDQHRGLTSTAVNIILKKDGRNTLTPPKKKSELVRFIKSMFQGFSVLLWIGALLCFTTFLIDYLSQSRKADLDNVYLGSVLIIVVVVTGLFSFYQEGKSSKIMESFKKMVPQNAEVIRESRRYKVSADVLVAGDIVIINAGDRIPADIRILECHNLKVDNSSLTGESEPVYRTEVSTDRDPMQSKNMVFFSTNAVEGMAKGIVIRTGDRTMMGQIAGITTHMHHVQSPINKEIKYFMKIISVWACFLGIIFFSTSMFLGHSWLVSTIFLIGIIVSNVPEGLLATVTVSLTLTSKRMAAKNCLVKNLEAVETLGSTSVICSDKTGTLTQNRMTVTHLFYNNEIVGVFRGGKISRKEVGTRGFSLLQRCAVLCSDAEFKQGQKKVQILRREVIGDASEAAILKCMEIATRGDVMRLRKLEPMVCQIPFNSTDKFKITIHLSVAKQYVLMMKGAPEIILTRCSTYVREDEDLPLTDVEREIIEHSCYELASWGERVLGLCDLELPISSYPLHYKFKEDQRNFPLEGLRFLGLVAMIDPPRPTVPDAVMKCRSAGIKIIMVTGDHPVTAKSIAKQVGIISEGNHTEDEIFDYQDEEIYFKKNGESIVVDGTKLRDLDQMQLDHLIHTHREIVFARTSPIQKLMIVESCQRGGAVVAVTGDGVNDSPALKKADIGIAMGISGSDVSKEAADMILLDDNFSSIVTGVEEGRLIFDNLKKSIAYVLASNVPEVTPFLFHIMLGLPLPLGVIAILCIDLGTDMWPAISLAYEKAESDIMKRPPRDAKKDKLVNFKLLFVAYGQIGMIEAAAGFYTYFVVMAECGFLPMKLIGLREQWDSPNITDVADSYGRKWTYEERKVLEYTCHTAFFVAIVIAQWADLIVCKTRYNSIVHQGMTNWVLNFGLLFETLLALLLCYTPGMQHVLKTYPLRAQWWLPAVPFAILIIVYDECRKYFIRKNHDGFFYRETYY